MSSDLSLLPPQFISFEGLDGVGKTTQINLLKQWFETVNIPTVFTREPGGTPLGETLRSIILNSDKPLEAETELLLMFAARVQHFHEVIKPALNNHHWVVTDRFFDSSLAYQGFGSNLPLTAIELLISSFLDKAQPNLTIWLDLPHNKRNQRLETRSKTLKKDRFEKENTAFSQRVWQGFSYLHDKYPDRIKKVDASQSAEKVHQQVISCIIESARTQSQLL